MALVEPKYKSSNKKQSDYDLGVPILWIMIVLGQGSTGMYFAVRHIDNFFGILATIYLLGSAAAIVGYHFFAAHKKPVRR